MEKNESRVERVDTGVDGLDEILTGGLVKGKTYALAGNPGTGKTILSIQILTHQAAKGKRCIYLSLVERAEAIRDQASSLGISMDAVGIITVRNSSSLVQNQNGDSPPPEYRIFPPSEVEKDAIWENIIRIVKEQDPEILVLDNLSMLGELAVDPFWYHKNLLHLMQFFSRNEITCLVHARQEDLDHDAPLSMSSDGVIELQQQVTSGRLIGTRTLEVIKTRCADFMSGRHPFRITSAGIRVFPHDVGFKNAEIPGAKIFSTGDDSLDELLSGGLESGTSTLLTGPSGVGKSVLGMQVLVKAAKAGTKAVLFSFEEPVESILTRSRALGMDVDKLMSAGTLELLMINPLQFYPDEFLEIARNKVQAGVRLMMFDSVRGYMLAMDQFGSLVAHVQNLVLYLRSKGITTIFTNEIENVTGNLKLSEVGVSYLADNILLLRFAEDMGCVIRMICCMKKRLSAYQPDLIEFTISGNGLKLGKKLSGMQGLLNGIPRQLA